MFPDVLNSLAKEISPNSSPLGPSVKYRKSVALSLFYKVSNKSAWKHWQGGICDK